MDNRREFQLPILQLLLPTVSSISIALLFSLLLIVNPNPRIRIQPIQGTGLFNDTANALIFVGLGSLLMLAIYVLFERTGTFFKRVLITFLITPTIFILTVFFGQTILLAFFKNNPNLLLSFLTLFTIYLSIFSAILILTDSLSTKARNFILLFYGTSLGVFLGFALPTMSTILLLLALGLEDYLIIGRYFASKEPASFESGIHSYFGLSYGEYKLGVGELVLSPVLTAHSLTNFGVVVCAATVICLITGIAANLLVAQRRKQWIVPGLLFPTILGIIPMIIHMLIA